MSFALSVEHRMKQEEFRKFAETELDTGEQFPWDNLRNAAAHGYMGYPIPVQWGGEGEDFLSYILLIEEVSRVCSSTGTILAVHTSVGTFPLLYFGTEEQKKRYLPQLAGGEMLGAFALTEAGAGSDAAALAATAVAVEGGYLLNGSKLFITSGGEADLYTLFATVDRKKGPKGITAFLVEKDSAGLSVGKPEKKMGLHRSTTTEIKMDNLFVPDANRLGAEGEGFSIAMSLLDGGRIGIAAQGLGLAGAAIDYTLSCIKQRETAGLRSEQGVGSALADLTARFEAARLLVYRAAVVKGAGVRCSGEAAMAKLFATDLAVEATTKCIDLCGFAAARSDNPLTRYFCDAKVTQIYEGSNQIQRIVIARQLLKQ